MTTLRPLRVAVIGAECTGKTTLCQALAQDAAGIWVPELLREFVERSGRAPSAAEQPLLIEEQVRREHKALAEAALRGATRVLFDSTPLVTALYSAMYFEDRALLAPASAHQRRYDLTLVTATDLPWEADGLQRDGPAMRGRFHALLTHWLASEGIAHALIEGGGAARLTAARAALDAACRP
jgi:nicotinamide riboside kinase